MTRNRTQRDEVNPLELGTAYEQTLSPLQRKRGSHFTPETLASRVASESLQLVEVTQRTRIIDPACGGGVFLLAMAQALHDRGFGAEHIVNQMLFGQDVDEQAVAVSRSALSEWAHQHGARAVPQVRCLDSLSLEPWLCDCFDVIVGNPPFQSQLSSVTSRTVEQNRTLSKQLGVELGAYADTAGLFCVQSLSYLRPNGVLALVLPRSLLATRDASPIRQRLSESCHLHTLWFAHSKVFQANVDVIVGMWTPRSVPPRPTTVRVGAEWQRVASVAVDSGLDTWSALWAASHRIPWVELDASLPTLGSVAIASAGFRDEYYGVISALEDTHGQAVSPEQVKVISTRLVDPNVCLWGRSAARLGKRDWRTPVVNLDHINDPKVQRWIARQRQPKTVVATQTKVVEAVADPCGEYVALTPLISVWSDELDPWQVTAALLAPPITAWLLGRFGGAGLSERALKVSAKQLSRIPLPSNAKAWKHAAHMLREPTVDWEQFARISSQAYGLASDAAADLSAWWVERAGKAG